MGDLRQRVVRGAEEIAALLDTPGNEIVDGRDAVFPAEGMDHIILIDVGQLREQLQIDALLKVAVDIPAHGGALLTGPPPRRRYAEREIGPAHKADQQHLQQVLTHHLIALRLCLDLPRPGK